jgi:hypothetical protein
VHGYQALAIAIGVASLIALVLLYGSHKASFDISADHLDQWTKSAQQSFSAQFKTSRGYDELS